MSAAATGRDLARAFAMAGSTFPFAVGIAFASAAVQLFGTSALHEAAELLAVNDPGELPALILAVWLHAVFIVTVAARATDPSEPASVPLFRAGISGGTILAAPILLFALLDSAGSAILCADGKVWRNSVVPDWPWLWIGWLSLALLGIPARILNAVASSSRPLLPFTRRLLVAAPAIPLIWLLGAAFQAPAADCDQLLSFGLFEGGLFLLPLLGLFWFVSSFTLAIHGATSLSPDTNAAHGPAKSS